MNFRLSFFACCLTIVAVTMVTAMPDTTTRIRDITVVKDIRDFARNHPGLKMQRLTKIQPRSSQAVRYTLGARVSGDRQVASGEEVFNYPAKKDVTIQLTYPESGNTGSIVTFVEIDCTQDSSDGNAYVVAGGIGQRFISIVLEANQTTKFGYKANYYGSS